MTQRDESDIPLPALELSVKITPEYQIHSAGKGSRRYSSLGRSTIHIVDLNGIVVLTAAAVPDQDVPDTIATAVERWRVTP